MLDVIVPRDSYEQFHNKSKYSTRCIFFLILCIKNHTVGWNSQVQLRSTCLAQHNASTRKKKSRRDEREKTKTLASKVTTSAILF